MRRALGLFAFVLALTVSLDAGAVTRVLLLPFSGRKAEVLREKVEECLTRAGYAVVPGDDPSPSAAASKLRSTRAADLMVSGVVRRQGMRRWIASLTVSSGDGEPIGEPAVFESSWLPGLAKELADGSVAQLEARFEQAKAPATSGASAAAWDADVDASLGAEAATEVAADVPEEPLFAVDPAVIDRDAPEEEGASVRAPTEVPMLKLRARGGMMRRSLSFVDDIYTRLRPLAVNSMVYQLDATLFPFHRPFGEYVGIVVSYERSLSSTVQDTVTNAEFTVGFEEFFAGLRGRHAVGRYEVGFDLTVGSMRSEVFDAGQANTPDFGYTLLRSSLDGALHFGALTATGSAGFRLPLSYGEVSEAEWFPRVGGYGVEATLGLRYAITRLVSVEVGGALRRYILEMNSEPDDASAGVAEVAGGAVDLYLSGYAGLSVSL